MDCWLLASNERRITCGSWSSTGRVSVLVNPRPGQVGCFVGTGETSPLAIATVVCGRRPIFAASADGAPIVKPYVEQ